MLFSVTHQAFELWFCGSRKSSGVRRHPELDGAAARPSRRPASSSWSGSRPSPSRRSVTGSQRWPAAVATTWCTSHRCFRLRFRGPEPSGDRRGGARSRDVRRIGGYHGFMALPTNLGPLHERAFSVAGGYKYTMTGEGACFLHCPPGYGPRPPDTGWFGEFGDLEHRRGDRVSYPMDGSCFAGATLDPTGLYRFTPSPAATRRGHRRRRDQPPRQALTSPVLRPHRRPRPTRAVHQIGRQLPHVLTFQLAEAAMLDASLRERRVITDHRGDPLAGRVRDLSRRARHRRALCTPGRRPQERLRAMGATAVHRPSRRQSSSTG